MPRGVGIPRTATPVVRLHGAAAELSNMFPDAVTSPKRSPHLLFMPSLNGPKDAAVAILTEHVAPVQLPRFDLLTHAVGIS